MSLSRRYDLLARQRVYPEAPLTLRIGQGAYAGILVAIAASAFGLLLWALLPPRAALTRVGAFMLLYFLVGASGGAAYGAICPRLKSFVGAIASVFIVGLGALSFVSLTVLLVLGPAPVGPSRATAAVLEMAVAATVVFAPYIWAQRQKAWWARSLLAGTIVVGALVWLYLQASPESSYGAALFGYWPVLTLLAAAIAVDVLAHRRLNGRGDR